jgi:deazaflavin-dependent oxidoreductase (nitroreductase family)
LIAGAIILIASVITPGEPTARPTLRDVATVDPALRGEQYCYLTTTGRVSGKPREIEIWFALVHVVEVSRAEDDWPSTWTVYMLSGSRDRSNWVRNLIRDPTVSVRIGNRTFPGRARIVEDPEEDLQARDLLIAKYSPSYSGDLSNWRQTSLPIAVDLETDSV